MNGREYLEWFNYHAACLSSVAGWFNNLPDADAVHVAWAKALDDVDLELAIRASDAILRGDIDRPYPEETPAVVRRYAANTTILSRPTFEALPETGPGCQLCRNSGHVTIWNRLVVKGVLLGINVFRSESGNVFSIVGPSGDVRLLTAAVGCSCRLGERFGHWMRKQNEKWVQVQIDRFNKSLYHCPVVFRTFQDIASMTNRERIMADINHCGITSNGAVEWEFDDEPAEVQTIPRVTVKRPNDDF